MDNPTRRTQLTPISHGHEWWRGASIYQIYPRSFADSNADGVGDLPGIIEHLPHIAGLGVEAIWISPFYQSPMRDFGYDVSDFRAVDPLFGAMSDFERLLDRAHELGMKVLIDQVFSHTSDQHNWFQTSRENRTNPKADWYVWADPKPDGSPPSNWQSVFGGPAWTWDARREQYYLHNFLPEQPDLNLHNREVQDAILDMFAFWLGKGVDGIRLDAVNFAMHDPALTDNPPVMHPEKRTRPFDFQHHIHNKSHPAIVDFLARIRVLADSFGDSFLVAEVGGETALEEMHAYTTGDKLLQSAYGFAFLYAADIDAELVVLTQDQWDGNHGGGWPAWTFSNHDAPRAVSRWAKEKDRAAIAALNMMLLACLRGNLIVYQGEELGLPQADVPYERLQDPEAIANWPQTLGRDGARTPMPWHKSAAHAGFSPVEPWLPVDPRHVNLAVDVQEADPHSTLHITRRAMAMRRKYQPLRTGNLEVETMAGKLVAFTRSEGDETLLCAFNLGDQPARWQLPKGWDVIEFINGYSPNAENLPPYACVIAKLA